MLSNDTEETLGFCMCKIRVLVLNSLLFKFNSPETAIAESTLTKVFLRFTPVPFPERVNRLKVVFVPLFEVINCSVFPNNSTSLLSALNVASLIQSSQYCILHFPKQ